MLVNTGDKILFGREIQHQIPRVQLLAATAEVFRSVPIHRGREVSFLEAAVPAT